MVWQCSSPGCPGHPASMEGNALACDQIADTHLLPDGCVSMRQHKRHVSELERLGAGTSDLPPGVSVFDEHINPDDVKPIYITERIWRRPKPFPTWRVVAANDMSNEQLIAYCFTQEDAERLARLLNRERS